MTQVRLLPGSILLMKKLTCTAVVFAVVLGFSFSPCCAGDAPAAWKAGVSRAVITPRQPMWMAGYAARNKPSEGKVHDLWCKTLAVEDREGTRLVMVTMDLIGIPRPLRESLEQKAVERWSLPPESLLLAASHTHCGPEIRMSKAAGFGLEPERLEQTREYCDHLEATILRLIDEAMGNLAPAELQYTHAAAGFAMNRRLPTEQGIRNRPHVDGPVDHDVPVLKVVDADGNLEAVVFGYACHNTTLSFYQFCGDYAGFAQQYLEEAHPGTTAMFIAGCGGDQNPQPRRNLELCQQHGRALANGVEAALLGVPRDIHGPLTVAMREIPLAYDELPGREQLEQWASSSNKWDRRRGTYLLENLERDGQLEDSYPYLVQMIRFDGDVALVALAGEVVVDYSLRLKSALDFPAVWVAAYANDVFGYVPSARMLDEGGYEPIGALRYGTRPAPFKPELEERIVATVKEMADR